MYQDAMKKHNEKKNLVKPTSQTNAGEAVDNKPFPPRNHLKNNKKLKYIRNGIEKK